MKNRFSTIKLGDIGKVLMCKRVLKHQTSEYGEIPFYKISTFGEKADTFITKELYEKFRSKYPHPKNGDILISAAGTVGKTVIYDGLPAYFQDSNIVWIYNDQSKILNQYLYYFYQTKPWLTTNGSTITRIYNDNLRSIKVIYPESLDDQQKIVDVLYSLDSKIELNNRINIELEQMAKTIYNYWFVQYEFPDVSGKPYKSNGGKMQYSDILKRKIPEGWSVESLGNILKTTLGGTPSTKINNYWENGAFNWLNSGEIAEFPIIDSDLKITESGISNSATSLLPKGTVLLSITRHLRATVLAIDACVNQSVVGIRENEYLKYYYIYPYLKNEIPRLLTLRTGAQQPHINKDIVDSSLIVYPSNNLNILNNYYALVTSMYQKINTNAFQNKELASLRNWLLPMLMNGQVTFKLSN